MLLQGVTTLARLVARVDNEAAERLWEALYGLLSDGQRIGLELLLEVPEGAGPPTWTGGVLAWPSRSVRTWRALARTTLTVARVGIRKTLERSTG
jgi:hypothetical protein